MNCPSCKAQLAADAKFCGICGTKMAPKPAGKASPGLGGGVGATVAPTGQAFAPQVPSGDPYVGMTLNNRFKIESKLGEGGFGAVYKGTQLGIGREVALKLLHPEMTRDQNLVARFRREGVVLCSLRDAHTITTYDFDQTPDGTLYIAMELLEGKSLHELFHSEAPIQWQRMFKIMSEMCSSLHEAHLSGIVHRDLKPENINLEPRPGNPEFVKVLDFGIAKVMRGDGVGGNQSPQLTATGQTLGTLEYMSPEQLMGKDLDGRSDIYALGVVSYELVTGRLPFPDAVGPAALISAQLRSVPDPPSKALPSGNIPSHVDAIILKMLEKDRNNRFADVMALRDELSRALQGGGQVSAGGSRPGANTPPPELVTTAPPKNQAPQPGADLLSTAPPQNARPPQQQQPPQAQQGNPYANAPNRASTPPPSRGQAAYAGPTSGSKLWLWIVLAIAAVGGGVGAFLALK